ncbi:MAG: TonB-dependent receptor [Reichenbachiella sp.]
MVKLRLFKMTWKHLLKASLMVMAFISMDVMAQDRTITGKVSSASGETIPGVSVLVKGTSTGTVTDIDGDFSLSIGDDNSTLVFSFIGMETQEATVGSRSVIDITLEDDTQALEEVIVTGYSVDSRRETTGSVATIKPKALSVSPSGNVEQQLQGRVAGVTVVTNGQPGTQSQVRVRGFGALGGNAPLYIVDGMAVSNTDFLSPDDIESTTVLKDATAASIYGARAAGGVIVFTTKKGKKGVKKMEVEYNGMFGVTTPGDGFDVMNPQDQADWTWTAIANEAASRGAAPVYNHPQYGTGETPVIPDYLLVGADAGVVGSVNLEDHRDLYSEDPNGTYLVIKANKEGTDWYDAITDNAFLQRHHIALKGSTEASRYYFGMGMQEQEGTVIGQKFSRYTMRANSDFDLSDKVRIGENIQATYRAVRLLSGGAGGQGSATDENVILAAQRMPTIIPTHNEFGGYAGTIAPGFNNPANPLAEIEGQSDDRLFQVNVFGNVYLEVEPVKDLTFKTSFGGGFYNTNGHFYSRRTYENSENNASFGFSQFSNYQYNWQWTNTINYSKQVGSSKIGVLLGQEALNNGIGRGMNGGGINPFSQNPDYITLSNVQSPTVNGGHFNGVTYASYFGRLTYDLSNKYLASVVVRRDGASRFGDENKYGVFPAFSLGWRLSEEGFMGGISWLDDMKIRGGYGIMGNSNNVSPNNQYSLYGTSISGSSYDITGSNTSAAAGYARTTIGNSFAQWERAITTNVGVDILAFDNKLDFMIEFWQKDTEDLLFQQPITVQTGYRANAPSVNVGEMRNRGIDLKIVGRGKIASEIDWEVTYNMGFLQNEIVSLAPGIESLPNRSSDYRGITPVLNQVGKPLSSFYGYEVQGIFADAAEVSSAASQDGAAQGRFRFKDLNNDGAITVDDRTYLGDPIPDFTGGLTLKGIYKSFELEVYSSFSYGNEIYNVSKVFTDFYSLFPGAAISNRVKDSWSTDNTGSDIPIFENVSNFSTNTQSNSYYVEDGSYFRLQNLTLRYNLPKSVLDALSMTKLQVYGSVNNLFTITKYSGLDPSVGGAADTNFGVDLGNFPITRSWTLGVSASF